MPRCVETHVNASPADDVMEFHADDADCSDETDFFFYCRWLFHRKMFISPQISEIVTDSDRFFLFFHRRLFYFTADLTDLYRFIQMGRIVERLNS